MRRHLASACLSITVLIAGSLPALANWEAGLTSYQQGDFASAIREFKDDDSAQSKFYLSMMYEKGEGTSQDRNKSVEMLQAAAEQGLDVAQADLGLLYLEGKGVPRNEDESIKWMIKAAFQGLAEARMVMQGEVVR